MTEFLKSLLIVTLIFTPIYMQYFQIRALKNRIEDLEDKIDQLLAK